MGGRSNDTDTKMYVMLHYHVQTVQDTATKCVVALQETGCVTLQATKNWSNYKDAISSWNARELSASNAHLRLTEQFCYVTFWNSKLKALVDQQAPLGLYR